MSTKMISTTCTVEPVYSVHLGTQKTVMIIEVPLYCTGSFIHIYIAMGPQLTPDYRGVLVSECPQ